MGNSIFLSTISLLFKWKLFTNETSVMLPIDIEVVKLWLFLFLSYDLFLNIDAKSFLYYFHIY